MHPMIPEAKAIVYEQLIGSIGDINKAIIGKTFIFTFIREDLQTKIMYF